MTAQMRRNRAPMALAHNKVKRSRQEQGRSHKTQAKRSKRQKSVTQLANSFNYSHNKSKRKRQVKTMERVLSDPKKKEQLLKEMRIQMIMQMEEARLIPALRHMTPRPITVNGGPGQ